MLHRRTVLGAAALVAAGPLTVRAQDPVLRIVVPFSAGSGTDLGGRVLGQAIHKTTGRTVIVDNKPGAGGVVGSLEVVRSRPDGSTLLYTTGGHTTNAALMKNLPYDPVTDFTPLTMVLRSSGFALLVSEKSPYKSLDELIAAARRQPGKLSFGSSGVGNTTHVMGVFFANGVGVDLLHVPFKGTPTTELIGGTVDLAFLSPSVAGPQIRAGQLRALGISGPTRSPMLPDVPTFAELGLKVQDIPAWSGIFGPPRMSPEVVRSLYDTLARAAQTQPVKDFVRENGGEVAVTPPEQFGPYVVGEIERYRKVLPPLGIQMS
ncbi:MAG TPA: tripartite tricarboxylate transporter substrate binding protein [Burkholderiaceae bacterium]|uniref:Tripartite tricarboxylate transporter substrate binding protein n=1 Tax=Variovorax paradoxus TaxID=34073 RepID=A0A2W5Q8M2_VARPD|nr:MAG: hypothetical protein DI563_11695 [Variovorax paradoxus]HZF82573.1 tripartite tricarboxylate transporter substrate binding protein [Burkholderiaceae bacterium]